MSSRISETLLGLGCLLLLPAAAFIVYLIISLLKIYGPLLLMIAILIYAPYMLVTSTRKK